MIRLRLVTLVLAALCAAISVEAVKVASIPCGGTIPIDSQYNLGTIWSLVTFRNRVVRLSGGAMSFSEQTLSSSIRNRVESETALNLDSVVVFKVASSALSNSAVGGSSDAAEVCSATLNPLLGGMAGLTSRSARLTVVSVGAANGASCSLPLNVSITGPSASSAAAFSYDSANSPFSKSFFFSTSGDSAWPVTLSFSSQCTLQFLLVVDRYGAISRWYVWIPTTAYTAVVVALLLPAVLLRRQLPVHLAGLYLFLLFFGYLGSCIGLVVELLQWQSSLGRMFPFPAAVTLYSCLCVLYMLLIVPALYRQGNNTVLFMGAARLFTYGLNCALCVGYWIAGYIVLGSLAVFQLLATNLILTWYYAYVTVHLRRAVRGTSSLPKFSNNFVYLWCVPVTPFACCALMYYDLYLLAHRDIKKDTSATRMRDVVRVYNAQMSLPLLFFQNVYGAALLATATAFHMPLVVLLFVALLLWIVHVVYTVEQYCREWSRWRRGGDSFTACGCISLNAVMGALLSNTLVEESATPVSAPVYSQVVSPVPGSVRRRNQPGQYEEDLAEYRNSQPTMSSTSDDDSYEEQPQRRAHRRHRAPSAGYSTPSRQLANDEPEYWPSSVER